MAQNHYAIITAGGRGTRLQTHVPKQFLAIGGKPILAHSLVHFKKAFPHIRLIITLPAQYHDYWNQLCKAYSVEEAHEVVEGGEERFHSIQKALESIGKSANGWVAIHDGVRPFVNKAFLHKAFEEAKTKGSAIPSIAPNSSLRQWNRESWQTVDRNNFRLIQTPQVFNLNLLKEAYDTYYQNQFTDDAGVYENAGHQVHLIQGLDYNIKITTQADFKIAQCLANEGYFT